MAGVSACIALLFLIALIGYRKALPQTPQVITTARELHRLGVDESQRGHSVRLRGVVTHYNWRTRLLVAQDATGGFAVSTDASAAGLGDLVEVEGFTSPGDSAPLIVRPRVKPLGRGELPFAPALSFGELASGKHEYRWVEVQGVVRSASVQHDTLLNLKLVSQERSLAILLSAYEGLEFASLVDATIRARGVAQTVFGAKGEVIRVQLFVSSPAHISVVEPVPADPFAAPATRVRHLRQASETKKSRHRVRVSGVVVRITAGHGLTLEDDTGVVEVRPSRMIPVEPGDRIDVLGFVASGRDRPVLEDAVFRQAAGASRSPNGSTEWPSATQERRVLHTTADVRNLTKDDAARGLAVRLQAVVTYYDASWSVMFVQDATGGIYVVANGVKPFRARSGDLVEVVGRSDAGTFAPQIANPSLRVIGRGSMPAAAAASLEDVFSGRLDSQWVEAEGVVQSFSEDAQHAWLDIVAGRYRFRAHTADLSNRALLKSLVDARVRVRGACGTLFNRKGQLIGIQIYVPDVSYIAVIRPGMADPFSVPRRPVGSLLQFDPQAAPGHRVRVQGVVTLRQPKGLFIVDADDGLFIEGEVPDSLRPGDQVDAVGFPSPRELAPRLRGAVVRKIAAGPVPEATPITAADAASGNYDARLVRVQARLLDWSEHPGEQILMLQSGRTTFSAVLPSDTERNLEPLPRGSILELTGICSARADVVRDTVMLRSLRILLRSDSDIAVVEQAPWWNVERALAAGSVLGAGLLAALLWGATLRKRVRTQTERIRVEMERQAALERRYAELFENANDIVFAHDLDGRVLSMNAAGARALGLQREDCASLDIFQLVVPEQHALVREAIARTASGGVVSPFEQQWTVRDGRRLALEVSARPVNRDGAVVSIEAIARDVTDRKQLEEQLRQAQKMEAVGRLAGGVAHDFNNLLGVITGYGELLRRQISDEQAHGRLDQIMNAADRAARLTRQLLAFSRKQVMQPRVLDLNAVVGDVEKMLQRVVGEDVAIETVAGAGLGAVKADPGQIEQVIMNLVINARDAMPHGGRLTIETANAELDETYAATHPSARPGRYVVLAVSDTGVGMDAETQRHIFEPFFTTKPMDKGTGLGLATVYGIVKQSGGSIWVYSEVGRGTTFKIYLPRVDEPVAARRHAATAAPVPRGSEVVLVVEDEDDLRKLVREILENAGYAVLEARHGAEALRLAEQHTGEIALVVTDVVMPGMSGPELVERLGRVRPASKVLYMSGYPDGAISRGGVLEAGAPLIEKPFTSHGLASRLRQILDGGSSGRGSSAVPFTN
jgi:PAS domain S-box-containing protein